MNKFSLLFVSVLLAFGPAKVMADVDPLQSLRALPIQDGGRVKPLDTFARESLSLIYGKDTYEGRPALEVVLTWLLQPQAWEGREFIEIRYNVVKKALRFEETRRYFSLKEILENEHLSLVFQELQSRREAKAKLDPYFQALQRLESQLGTFRGIASGDLLRFVPIANSAEGTWLPLGKLEGDLQTEFAAITKLFISDLALTTGDSGKEAAVESLKALQDKITSEVEKFESLAKANNPAVYPEDAKIKGEIFYNQFRPFQKAWILYFLAALVMALLWIFKYAKLYYASWALVIGGLAFHILGFALRVYLTGRPPVSNMYETVVWVGFGALIFSIVIEAIYRWQFALLAGSLVAGFCLLLSDNAPVVLDSSLQPLQAVLNSNFWLTTHVLTITISYAAFFLAFALGDIGLLFYLRGDNEHTPRVKAVTLSIYRAIQIGVSLLAPGIILGGIWADYSWGRFWGWDPKETWALIALLGYVAVLHGRIGGLIKGFGLVVCSVVTFSLVIMAWYGVNYVLGAGLHSYGFGAGGVEYVAAFVGIHMAAVIFVAILRSSRLKSGVKSGEKLP